MIVQLREVRVLASGLYAGGGTSSGLDACEVAGRRWLLKRYRPEAAADIDARRLIELIHWRAALAPARRQRLDTLVCLPLAVVEDGPEVAGVLIPESPACTRPRLGARRAGPAIDASCLRSTRDDAEASGYGYVELPHKLAVVGHLLDTVLTLHGSGIVVGDLHERNVLVSLDQHHVHSYLIDSDSFVVDGHRINRSVADPQLWRCEHDPDSHTANTDLHKIGLLLVRAVSEQLNVQVPAEAAREALHPKIHAFLGDVLSCRGHARARQVAQLLRNHVTESGRLTWPGGAQGPTVSGRCRGSRSCRSPWSDRDSALPDTIDPRRIGAGEAPLWRRRPRLVGATASTGLSAATATAAGLLRGGAGV